jgi:hypothetical protein
MSWRWRILLATLCVEAVVVATVPVYGAGSLVAVAVIYWLDLAFVTVRAIMRHLVEAETPVLQPPRALPQFRLLEDKRGTLTVSERLPPVYLRSLPTVLFSTSILAVSALSTAVVLTVSAPARFWTDPMTPLVLVGGGVATAAKSWLVYTDNSVNGRGSGLVATKRQLLVLLYAPLLYLVTDITTAALTEPEMREAVVSLVFGVVVARLIYAVYVSRPRSAKPELFSRVNAVLPDSQPTSAPTQPLVPEGKPLETAQPVSGSALAAGAVNVLTTGGVVDGQFSDAGLHLRVYLLFVLVPGALAAVTGSVGFQILLVGVAVFAVVVWLLGTLHMELAFGKIEYRFYESAIVAYDRRLDEPQWSIPYETIEGVAVKRGLFHSPAWLDAGSVTLELTDGTVPMVDEQGRASILFLSEPERISKWVSSHSRDVQRSS